MYKLIFLIFILSGCVEVPNSLFNQVDYVCINGWQWNINGAPITDSAGNQLTCEIITNPDKSEPIWR